MKAKRRYWDEGYEGWVHSDPVPSTEDQFFAALEEDPEDLMPEMFLALNRLTDKQRFVVECRYGLRSDGRQMTVDEIGDLLGVTHQSVVRLIQRALKRLEQELWRLRTKTANTSS